MKKKIIAAIAVLLVGAALLSGCRKELGPVTGKTITSGIFTALLPDDWINSSRNLSEDGKASPNILFFERIPKKVEKVSYRPYVKIEYEDPSIPFKSTRDMYDKTEDLVSVKFQDKELENCFYAEYDDAINDYGFAVLEYNGDDAHFYITIVVEVDEKPSNIAIYHREVQAIINSITLL